MVLNSWPMVLGVLDYQIFRFTMLLLAHGRHCLEHFGCLRLFMMLRCLDLVLMSVLMCVADMAGRGWNLVDVRIVGIIGTLRIVGIMDHIAFVAHSREQQRHQQPQPQCQLQLQQ